MEYMRLLSYYPIYIHDTETAMIPEVYQKEEDIPLSLGFAEEDEALTKHFRVKTVNPNVENQDLIFGRVNARISDDVPFIDRTVYLFFDIISVSDEKEKIKERFQLFEMDFRVPGTAAPILTGRLFMEVDFDYQNLGSESVYEGNLTLILEHNQDGSSIFNNKMILGVYNVQADGNSSSINNSYHNPVFSKKKYTNMDFRAVLNPNKLTFNVKLT